jgi:hypothetical protein
MATIVWRGLLAGAGGKRPVNEKAKTALHGRFHLHRSTTSRLEDIRYVFLAGSCRSVQRVNSSLLDIKSYGARGWRVAYGAGTSD